MRYGNPDAGDGENAENVWDSNFVMVNHMGDLTDSTSNGNDGTNNGSTLGVDENGYYRSFSGSGGVDFVGGMVTQDNNTVDVMFSSEHTTSKQVLFWEQYNGGNLDGVWVRLDPVADLIVSLINDGSTETLLFSSGEDGFCDGAVHVISSRFSSGDSDAFVDETNNGSATGSYSGVNSTNPCSLGYRKRDNADPLFGTIREVRLSGSKRSDAWIKATSEALHNTLLTVHPRPPKVLTVNDVHSREIMRGC